MTLPFDICTSLWLRSVPKWEWEPVPEAPESPEGATVPPSDLASDGGNAAEAAPMPARPPAPLDASAERPGFRLVFKGFEIAGSVFWFPADSPLSRPWVAQRDDAHDDEVQRARRRPGDEPPPDPGDAAAPPGATGTPD